MEGAHKFTLFDGCHASSGEDVEEKRWERVGWEDLQVVYGKGVTGRSGTVTLQYPSPWAGLSGFAENG